jgi:1-acyl-sn-glycerol-3-phosphate acyltransferase
MSPSRDPAPRGQGAIAREPRPASVFPGGTYVTPAATPVSLLGRLLGGWRWAFYSQYVRIVLEARGLAVRGVYDDSAWAGSSLSVLRLIERFRGRFVVSGLDNLRAAAASGPYVFVANHMSTLETQVLPVLIVPFMPVTFVVKEGLVKGNVFGPVLRSRDPIAVRRKSPREDLEAVLDGGVERLRRGISIVVFPQSTRSPVFRPEGFNTLGTKLAARAGVSALPVAIKSDFWGEEGLFRGFGPIRPERTVHFEFGRPMPVSGRGKEQHLEIVRFIESRLRLWAAESGAAPPAGRVGPAGAPVSMRARRR